MDFGHLLIDVHLQLSLAGHCAKPKCDPKHPQYFKDTEALAECVLEQTRGGKGDRVSGWEITLPNDHIWSGTKNHGTALKAQLGKFKDDACKPVNFTGRPIDMVGTVDTTFTTTATCKKKLVEKALYDTMEQKLAVKCKKIKSLPASLEGL